MNSRPLLVARVARPVARQMPANPRSCLSCASCAPFPYPHVRARDGRRMCASTQIQQPPATRATQATARVSTRSTRNLSRNSRNHTSPPTMQEKKGAVLMPLAAELMAELRAKCGAELIDGALAASQQARREFKRLQAEEGEAAAQAWLRRQRFPKGRIWLVEGDRNVGIDVGAKPCN